MTAQDGGYAVPKRDLVAVLSVLLQGGRLAIAKALPLADEFLKEAVSFRARIGAGGHDSDGSADDWRDGVHADLIFSVAISAWVAGRRSKPIRPLTGPAARALAEFWET